MTSTRRFLARPSFVALSAIGEVSPLPRMVILDGSTPCLTRKSLTVAARCSESFWLYWLVPVLSVCPVICTASTEVTRRTCSRSEERRVGRGGAPRGRTDHERQYGRARAGLA